MNKFNSLALATTVGYVLTGCSTQQMAPQGQVIQNTPQSQIAQNTPQSQVAQNTPQSQAGLVATAKKVKPVNKPVVVAVRPNNPRAVKARVIPVKAKPVVTKRPAVKRPVTQRPAVKRPAAKPRATPPAPRVRTVKKPTPPVSAQQAPWMRRQLTMSLMPSWQMGGRAALRFKSNAWTFGLNWVQRNKQQFSLQIRNPITGTIVGLLDQSPGKATLKSRGKVSSGPDAERLLQQQLGVKMPVNGMPYWIRGVMAPQYPVGKVTLDAKGRPKQIVQAGWVMDYFNYQSLSFDAMPRKVNISRKQEQVNVRILAKRWKTR